MPPPVSSVESVAAEIGHRCGAHMDRVVRRMMHQGEAGPSSFRMITGEAHPFGNMAMITAPADVALTQTAASPLAEGPWPAALIYPVGVSDEVREAAAGLGFTTHEMDPAMAVNIADLTEVTLPDGYEWERVVDGPDAEAWTETLAAGYGLPLPVARLFSPLNIETSPEPDADVQFFGVKHNGRMVATSMLMLADGLAGIYCVATLEDQRGKGLGGFVTAEALQVASGLGYRVGVLQSSPPGQSVYRRIGFTDVGEVHLFVRMPEAS